MEIFTYPSQAESKLVRVNQRLGQAVSEGAKISTISYFARIAMEISTELVILRAIKYGEAVCIDADRIYNADYAFSAELHSDEFGVLHSKHGAISVIL